MVEKALRAGDRELDSLTNAIADLLTRWGGERFIESHPAAWVRAAHAANRAGQRQDAEHILQEAQRRFPGDAPCYIEHAWLAGQDNEAAAARWLDVCNRFPDLDIGYVRAVCTLSNSKRFDEAEAVAEAGLARFPGVADIAHEHAWTAIKRGDVEAALLRFAALRQQFPTHRGGYAGGSVAFGRANQLDAAEQVLREGVDALPDDPHLHLEYAKSAFRVGKPATDESFLEVRRRFAILKSRFPDFQFGSIAMIDLLRRVGAHEDAEAEVAEAHSRWPKETRFALEYAKTAADGGRWAVALERYSAAVDAFENLVPAHVGKASCLLKLERYGEADSLLAEAIERFPASREVREAYAFAAAQVGDWVAAEQRWAEACRLFPHDEEFARRHFEAKLAAVGLETADARADNSVSAAPVSPSAALLMRFESLGGGDRQGCEFGLFQRAMGAEPLGLLRWTSIEPHGLGLALSERFESFGSEETTVLDLWDFDRGREYVLKDKRYETLSHTFVFQDQLPIDKMMVQSRRRLKFLARKLISDLEEGAKIFVYRTCSRDLTDNEVDALHSKVAQYGRNSFLYVRYADSTHPNGHVEVVRNGLLFGYMDRFQFSRSGERLAPATSSWLRVCQNAATLV